MKKPKGPIRTGLVSIIVIFCTVVFCYCYFFLDNHIRYVLSKVLTNVNNAEVDIADVSLSFKEGSIYIRGIQFTNFDEPEYNSIQIGEIGYNVSWDALLRAKIVIEDAKLLDLAFNQKRKKPGKIYPKLKEEKEKQEESKVVKELKGDVKAAVTKKGEENVLGDVVTLLQGGGGDIKDNLKNIKFDLKSEQKINELKSLVEKKQEQWKSDVKEIKELDELKKVYAKAKGIKISKDPKTALKQLKEFKSLKSEADGYIKQYKSKISALKDDYKGLKNEMNSLDDLYKEDLKALKEHFKLPSLNLSEMAQGIFGSYVKKQIAPYMKYWYTVKEYIPEKKPSKEEKLTPHQRAQGVTYHYPKKKGYPFFWLKEMDISSRSQTEKGSADVSYQLGGFVKDLSSNNTLVGRPLSFKIAGDMPAKKVNGLLVEGIVEKNEQEKFQAKVNGKVNSYQIEELKLSNSSKLKLALTDTQAQTKFSGVLGMKEGDLKVNTSFSSVDWKIQAEKSSVDKILNTVFGRIPQFTLNSNIYGFYLVPKIKIDSDFDNKFGASIKQYVGEEVKKAEAKLRNMVDEKVANQKKELFSKLGKTEQEYLKPLLSSENNLQSFSKNFSDIGKKLEKEQKNKVKSKAKSAVKKELNKLKDKFGF
ncbi:MAG: TIGR03545 family protein [Halobacteriovoraceae bacterium]|nr:TIGR03545 family protein [Halobacteriovoraceae bacterium]MCB9095188.1 TIGR03545 family protein [Halobacteriovoraceae bacterium]